ncbi:MAG TPA: nuclear transport factor 2 family protein [Gemmatimonadaceae bacterium]
MLSVVIGVVAVLPLLGRGVPARPCEAAPASAVQTGRDTQSVLNLEQAWIRAIAQRDTSTVACILADDFLDTSWQGVLRSKRDQIHGLAKQPPRYTPHYSDWRVHLYGNTAVVRGLNVMTDSRGHEVGRLRFTDVFAYRDGQWQAVAAQETMVAPK